MSKRELPLWTDPLMKKEVGFRIIDEDTFAVDTRYDVQDVVDRNAAIRAVNKTDWKGENLVGGIPIHIWQLLKMTHRMLGLSKEESNAAMLRFLMDPDNSKFKVKSGRL